MIHCKGKNILSFLFFISTVALAQSPAGRNASSIDDGWSFLRSGAAYAETVRFDDSNWEKISLPHTWNACDPFDDDKTYTRSIAWYRKRLQLDPSLKEKKVYLYFEGANQVTNLYVNGYFAGQHKGGFTGFAMDISRFLNWKDATGNTIAVQVNNAHDPFVPPLNVGYASYGGIYRDAWLITTGLLHFKDINNNSGGVYITTPAVSKEQATVSAKTIVYNETGKLQTANFINTLYDVKGNVVTSFTKTITVETGASAGITATSDIINSPQLWNPSSPYLYTLVSQLTVNGQVVDEVRNKTGFRWFSFDDKNGFILNGQKLPLHGTNRHQDMQGKGDALSQEDHRRDMQLIKDMGCNFVRLAHYPQAATVLSLADELGLLVWEETPVVNFITNHAEFLDNSKNMIHEMITQGYNHPSVVLWGSSNEILLHGPDGERIGKQNDTAYLKVVRKTSLQLDSTVRAEDRSRYSTVAMHVSDDYAKYGLDTVSQVAGYNIYSGWYSGDVKDFSADLDSRRKPGHIVFVSEYGAEGEIRLNTEKPLRLDYTTQYQRFYHEAYLRQINQRPWLAGTAIWNEFDFSQPNIGGPQPHMNQKGLITWDRKTKDAYYLYKANWNPNPMVYIATRDWLTRAGEITAASTIDVYSNAGIVSLTVNGIAQKQQPVNDLKRATWQVQLKDGDNTILASAKVNGKLVTDQVVIRYRVYDARLNNTILSKPITINVGSNAQYLDASGTVWIEDRPYQKGSFGFIAGTAKMVDRKEVIANTSDEPLFYTYRDSIQGYRFDLPDGQYKVTLFFTEPTRMEKGKRIFSININNSNVLNDLDLSATYGPAQAVSKTFVVTASNSTGVEVKFNASKGGAVLSGIRVE